MNDHPQPILPLDQDLNSALGFHVDAVEVGRVTGHFAVENQVRQPFGIVHGGAHAAFAETLASVGTFRAVAESGNVAMGMSNNTTFLRSVNSGVIHAEAIALSQGKTTWVWDVTLKDEQDRVCAVSRVTIAVRERRRA
ncbi:MAG: PaaI family thioesterase [Solirubrobacterales bacterium]|nr:PaaI family thioesterase [Solirubrobacterales bacterium]